jgi:hypothetical protein
MSGSFALEFRAYLLQVRGLWPGVLVPSLIVHQIDVGSLDGWTEDDCTLLIEQAREQLNRQRIDMEAIRQRAQFLFTTCLGTLGLAGLAVAQMSVSLIWFLLGAVGTVLIVGSLLGAAGVVVARKDLGIVDSVLLSKVGSPIRWVLAKALAESVQIGENTVATLITVYRDAVLLLLAGVLALGTAFLGTL